MLEVFLQTTEYREYLKHGFESAAVLGAIGGLMILIPESWGLYRQAKEIWDKKSAEGLSVYWFGYTVGFILACIPYGLAHESAAIVVTVVIFGGMHLPILYGIYTFRGFTRSEKFALVIFSLMLPIMIWSPWMDAAYLAFSAGTVFATASQPWKMWRERSRGNVDVWMLSTFVLGTVFWTVYAFAINALALMILNPTLCALFVITIVMWVKYPTQKVVVTQ